MGDGRISLASGEGRQIREHVADSRPHGLRDEAHSLDVLMHLSQVLLVSCVAS